MWECGGPSSVGACVCTLAGACACGCDLGPGNRSPLCLRPRPRRRPRRGPQRDPHMEGDGAPPGCLIANTSVSSTSGPSHCHRRPSSRQRALQPGPTPATPGPSEVETRRLPHHLPLVLLLFRLRGPCEGPRQCCRGQLGWSRPAAGTRGWLGAHCGEGQPHVEGGVCLLRGVGNACPSQRAGECTHGREPPHCPGPSLSPWGPCCQQGG